MNGITLVAHLRTLPTIADPLAAAGRRIEPQSKQQGKQAGAPAGWSSHSSRSFARDARSRAERLGKMQPRLKAAKYDPDAEQNGRADCTSSSIWAWRSWMQRYAESDARSTRLRRASLPSRPNAAVRLRGQCCRAPARCALAGRRGQALQFYDKLIQRLTHVPPGRPFPRMRPPTRAPATSVDWNNILDQVRRATAMVEERVLFDFMMRDCAPSRCSRRCRACAKRQLPGLELILNAEAASMASMSSCRRPSRRARRRALPDHRRPDAGAAREVIVAIKLKPVDAHQIDQRHSSSSPAA